MLMPSSHEQLRLDLSAQTTSSMIQLIRGRHPCRPRFGFGCKRRRGMLQANSAVTFPCCGNSLSLPAFFVCRIGNSGEVNTIKWKREIDQ
jgi:hypothetical protein